MTRPLADALCACLRLMARATPHPDDRDLWPETMREAAKLLAQQSGEGAERPVFLRIALWVAVALIALALAIGWTVSPAASQESRQNRVTVHHDPAPGDVWFARLVIVNRVGIYNETELLETDHGTVAVTYTTTRPAKLNDPDSADHACATDLPPGVVARPDCVTMLEATTGTIFLIRYIGG